jgi:hypothetical protein
MRYFIIMWNIDFTITLTAIIGFISLLIHLFEKLPKILQIKKIFFKSGKRWENVVSYFKCFVHFCLELVFVKLEQILINLLIEDSFYRLSSFCLCTKRIRKRKKRGALSEPPLRCFC